VTIELRLLGSFEVRVDGVPVAPDQWTRRQAASLVKVLALAPGRRLHREQAVEALWPGADVETAGPRLHKAAHYARRALGGDGAAVTLRNDMVALLPDSEVETDVEEFRALARRALAEGGTEEVSRAIASYAGTLLPDDVYEPWAEEARASLSLLHLDLLRRVGRWEQVLEVDPTDEAAHLALVRAHTDRGDVRSALRQFERLDHALQRELGTTPSPEAERVRERLRAAVGRTEQQPTQGVRLVGRRDVGDRIRQSLARADEGRGSTLLFSGPPGVGKTSVLGLAEALARQRDWRVGRGTASAVEGPWPYAPVLEAFGDLCRQHPALLDGLDDRFRLEIDRALSGKDVSWTGESSHQRLFVAVAELMRLAATGHGLLLAIDDLQDADEASLRLLHYLSRCAVTEPVLIAVAHRPRINETATRVAESLVRRGAGTRIELKPLDQAATRRLVLDRFPDLPTETVVQVSEVSGGLPFAALELGSNRGSGAEPVLPVLPTGALQTFQRLALLGQTFITDELLVLSEVDEDTSYQHLEAALGTRLVEPAEAGYRFRHALIRERLVQTMPEHVRATAWREVAVKMAALGGPPARMAHLFVEAGLASRAVPYALRAVETAGALGAYRDGLSMIEAVRNHAGPAELPRLLARRGDLLQALGDPEAVRAYQEAAAVTSGTEHRLVRARMARAAAFTGELETAREALAGLEVEGDVADGSILLARGNLAFFSGDIDTAWEIANQGRVLLNSSDDPWQLMDLISLQGLVAHQRGEWFERFRMELHRTRGKQRLATALFDAHLCVAEYLLYGPVPYREVISEAEDLLRQAEQAGALRGVAFARALIGEAALLMNDLDRAERELVESVDLHRDIDAPAGEAHSLQRLAEVRLAQGDREEARRLLERALPLARWSVIAMHLIQRVYGTMIQAAPDAEAARALVDQAEATLGDTDACSFCVVMLAVPAAIACAEVGDLDTARDYVQVAERSAARWPGTAWAAAAAEARAHIARAEQDLDECARLLDVAERGFAAAGQPGDAARCASTLAGLTVAST
jgi:DNA-binding SARP family transcriptional activator/tetratricopeptide (TPR) repeat protein